MISLMPAPETPVRRMRTIAASSMRLRVPVSVAMALLTD
jgi:hypothetical protein